VTPPDNHDSDLGGGRQKRRRGSVTRDTTTGQHDKPLSPSDSDDRPNQQPNESSYAAAPATNGSQAAGTQIANGTGQSTGYIRVEDGHVVAALDPVLTNAAADVLWRVIYKAMRKGEIE
jgi:hypothetical protein